ncbi:MAG: hypothetical protein AAGF76_08495, partial [Pseudomonadota bacterium]
MSNPTSGAARPPSAEASPQKSDQSATSDTAAAAADGQAAGRTDERTDAPANVQAPPPAPAAPPPCPAGSSLGIALALLAGGGFALVASYLPQVAGGTPVGFAVPWVPPFGIDFAIRLDGLAMVFALLITGFAAAISIYARSYLTGHRHLGRFFIYLGLFTAAMLGVVLADDLFLLFVFWEMTTVSSFLLVAFSHENATARRNAWQALLITGMGGLALLA